MVYLLELGPQVKDFTIEGVDILPTLSRLDGVSQNSSLYCTFHRTLCVRYLPLRINNPQLRPSFFSYSSPLYVLL